MSAASYDSRIYNICYPLATGTSSEEFVRSWLPAFLDGATGVFADISDDINSLWDHLEGLAPGSPNGPAIAGGAGGADARAERAKRQKVHYAQIIRHVLDPDLKVILRGVGGDANAAWDAVKTYYVRPQNQLRSIDQELDWTQISMELIGYHEHSPRSLWSHILRVNGERPAADQKDENTKRAKFLSCIKFPDALKTIAESELQHFTFANSQLMLSSFQERWSKRFREGEIRPRAGTLVQTQVNPTNRVDARMAESLEKEFNQLIAQSPALAAKYNAFLLSSHNQEDGLTTFDAFRNTAIAGVSYNDFSFCWNCWGADHRFKSVDGAIICPSQQKRRHLPDVITALQKISKTGQGSRETRPGPDRARGVSSSKGKFKFRFKQKHPAAHLSEAEEEQLVDVDECGVCYDQEGQIIGSVDHGETETEVIESKVATVSTFAAGAVSSETLVTGNQCSSTDDLKSIDENDYNVLSSDFQSSLSSSFSAEIHEIAGPNDSASDSSVLPSLADCSSSDDEDAKTAKQVEFYDEAKANYAKWHKTYAETAKEVELCAEAESKYVEFQRQRKEEKAKKKKGIKTGSGLRFKNVFAVVLTLIAIALSFSAAMLRNSTFLALLSLTSACTVGDIFQHQGSSRLTTHSSNFYRSSAFDLQLKLSKKPSALPKDSFAVLDTGTTKNSTGNEKIFPSKTVTVWNPAIRVEIANGVLLPVKALGIMLIPVKGWNGNPKTFKKFSLPLQDSILVKGLNCTLLSPKSMFKLQGIKTFFNDDLYFVLPDGTHVDFDETERNYLVYFVDDPDFILEVKAFTLNITPVTAGLIHSRMVHFSWDRIRASEDCTVGLPFDSLPDQLIRKPCIKCLEGVPPRRKKKSRPKDKYTHFGHTVSSDICAMPKSTPFGFTAMLAFYDWHSRFIALYYIRAHNTEEVMNCYKLYHADHGKDMKNGHVETWLLDNDSVFLASQLEALCAEMLTRLRYISAWNPWQNATETVWRIILRPLRITIAATNASEALWPFAADQIVRCHNGLASYSDFIPAPSLQAKFFASIYAASHTHPHGVAQRTSPYFMKTGRKSDFTWTRVLFCHVNVRIRNHDDLRKITKVSPLTTPGVHLCQDDRRAGYYVYLFGPQRFTTAAWEDCTFDEERFPVINRILGHSVFGGKHTSLPSREQQEQGEDSQPVFQRPRDDAPRVDPAAPPPGQDPAHGSASGRQGDAGAARGDWGPNHCREPTCTLPGGHPGFHSFERVRTPNDGRILRDRTPAANSSLTYAHIVAAVRGYYDCDFSSAGCKPDFSSAHDMRTHEDYLTSNCDPSGFYCAHLTDEFPIYFNTQCELISGVQPGTLKHELKGCFRQEWIEACIKDIKAKIENKTYTLVEDEGQIWHPTGFALVHKWNDDMTLKERRARWVGRGYTQIEERDYKINGLFSATPTSASVRGFGNFTLAINGHTGLTDVVKAFTLSDMDRIFHAQQPFVHIPGMTVLGKNGKPKLALMHKSLEGFKQAGNLFQTMHSAFLTNAEGKRTDFIFTKSTTEPCLFICHSSRGIIGCLVWIDDIWVSFNGRAFYLDFKKIYQKRFPSKFSEPCDKFVGITVDHNHKERSLALSQIPFIEKAHAKFMPKDRAAVDIPALHDRKNPRHYSKFTTAPSDSQRLSMRELPFLALYATLLFANVMTLPSITYNMSFLGQFMQDPSPDQWEALLDVLSYCYSTRKQNVIRYQMVSEPSVPKPFYRSGQVNDLNALLKGFSQNMGLHGWADGSWLLRSVIGYIIMCNGAALDWKTGILRVVCHSSAEAEISAGSLLTKKEMFFRALFKDMLILIKGPIPNLIDNTAAIELSNKDGASKKTNHFLRWQHTMRWGVMHLYTVLLFVFTHEQLANVLTKPVDLKELKWFCKIVYNHKAERRSSDYLPKKSTCVNPVDGTGSAVSHQ